MKRCPLISICFFVLLCSCQDFLDDFLDKDNGNDEECREIKETYTLSGHVSFDGYERGPIELTFTEDASSVCGSEKGTVRTRTPGALLGTVTLDKPGPFEISLTHTRLDSSGTVWNGDSGVYVVAKNRKDDDGTECAGAAMVLLIQRTQSNIRIVLEPQSCPMLL